MIPRPAGARLYFPVMPTAIRAVLFDLDGVLVTSTEPWFLSVAAASRRFRGATVTRAEFTPTFGQGTAADIAQFGLRCTAAELDAFYLETFPRFADRVAVSPDAAPLLTELGRRGLGRAVVTNTVLPLARLVVEAAGLAPLLEVVAGASEVAHAKPAPDVVHLALARLGAPAAAAVMIGDSRYDREAAAAAGVRFIGLGTDGAERVESLAAVRALIA
jgi:phosphoglycolate phosphatase/AHBA synthesis associated protein